MFDLRVGLVPNPNIPIVTKIFSRYFSRLILQV